MHGLPDIDDALAAQWLAELPADYQQRLSRLRIRRRLVQSLIGLQLLKKLAAERDVRGFRLDRIRTTTLGKPHADDLADFSISHDEELVACALTDHDRVGLDVECVREINIGHFARVFSTDEFAWIDNDSARFFALWTRKEAAVKVSGEHGIGHLQAVTIEDTRTELDARPLYLQPLDLAPGYAACVAADAPITDVCVRRVVWGTEGDHALELLPTDQVRVFRNAP